MDNHDLFQPHTIIYGQFPENADYEFRVYISANCSSYNNRDYITMKKILLYSALLLIVLSSGFAQIDTSGSTILEKFDLVLEGVCGQNLDLHVGDLIVSDITNCETGMKFLCLFNKGRLVQILPMFTYEEFMTRLRVDRLGRIRLHPSILIPENNK